MEKNLCTALACLALVAPIACAAPPPSGEVVELHACELYTGGCTASAQSTLGGRALLRVWNFENGAHEGIDLSKLQLAALETAEANLAFPDTRPASTVVYLPAEATSAQRGALLGWLKQHDTRLANAPFAQRVVDIEFVREGARITVQIGNKIALQTRALDHCDAGGCGEQLWYAPRTPTTNFTVLVNDHSSIAEPALALTWKDHGVKTVFLGSFGEAARGEGVFTLALSE